MNIEKQLKDTGLHSSEITVYLYLLEHGMCTPPQIAKGTGITRTNCYRVLGALKEKDFIQTQIWRKKTAYLASDPISMVRFLDKKKIALEQVLPDLRALLTLQKNKPKIKFYNGWEEVKEVYIQSLSAREIFAIGSAESFHVCDPKFFKKYRNQLWKRKIFFRDILGTASRPLAAEVIQKTLRGYYSVKYLPKKDSDPKTDIVLWGDNVAFVMFEEPIFGTVLTNPFLAQTFRIIFSTLWERL